MLHGSLFEYFITKARNDRYNIMCSLVAHYKKQPACEYDEMFLGDRLLPKNVSTEELEALCATLNFIDIWLKLLEENDEIRSGMYNKSIKYMFKQIPLTMMK